MPEALQSGHAPLLDLPPPTSRPARVHVLRRNMPQPPRRPRWTDHLRENLEPLLFAATVVLAVLAFGLWAGQSTPAAGGADLRAAPTTGAATTGTPAPKPAQAG